MSNVGTIPVEMLLPLYQHSGDRRYVGRHRVTDEAPLYTRAARWIANEWPKPRAWTTAIGDRIAAGLSTDQADRAYDLLTGETFRNAGDHIARAWRNADRAAYARLPATWRHRIEARASARAALAQQRDDTELWWAARSVDYAPTLHRNIDTQQLPTIKEKTPA